MKTITVFDFIKAIKEDVQVIKVITSDNHALHICRDNDDDDFKHRLVEVVLNRSVDEYEINYSSKTKTLQIFTTMSLQQIDHVFCKKGGAE